MNNPPEIEFRIQFPAGLFWVEEIILIIKTEKLDNKNTLMSRFVDYKLYNCL